jgi:hypothetical protein
MRGVLISLHALVTGSLFHSSRDVLEPAHSAFSALSRLLRRHLTLFHRSIDESHNLDISSIRHH